MSFLEELAKKGLIKNSQIDKIKNLAKEKYGGDITETLIESGINEDKLLEAKGEYVLFTDMDQATPIEEIDNLMPFFDEKYDIVIGSRKSQRKGTPGKAPRSRGKIQIGLSEEPAGIPQIFDHRTEAGSLPAAPGRSGERMALEVLAALKPIRWYPGQ